MGRTRCKLRSAHPEESLAVAEEEIWETMPVTPAMEAAVVVVVEIRTQSAAAADLEAMAVMAVMAVVAAVVALGSPITMGE
jgi:hypothetical protein